MAKSGSDKGMEGAESGEWGIGNEKRFPYPHSPLPTPYSLFAFFVLLALFASTLHALSPAGSSSRPQSHSQISNAGYVEAGACVECHREIAESYARTAMARTFGAVRSENNLPEL